MGHIRDEDLSMVEAGSAEYLMGAGRHDHGS